MSDNCRVSEALYVGLCGYIGTPTEVTIRRDVLDMEEMIFKHVYMVSSIGKMQHGD